MLISSVVAMTICIQAPLLCYTGCNTKGVTPFGRQIGNKQYTAATNSTVRQLQPVTLTAAKYYLCMWM